MRFSLQDGGLRVLFRSSVPGSSPCSCRRLFLPYPKTTYECIRVFTKPGMRRQFFEFLGVSTAEYDLFGLQGVAKLPHNLEHVLLPSFSAQALQAPHPNVVFECLAALVRQVS